jgi:branched-subunit amino acid transport protein
MNFWFVLIASGLLTFAIRLSFILIVGHRQISSLLMRALRFVPPAVLTAIILPEIVMPGGNTFLSFQNARLFSGLIAIIVAWRTRSILSTILVGMATLWIIQSFIP